MHLAITQQVIGAAPRLAQPARVAAKGADSLGDRDAVGVGQFQRGRRERARHCLAAQVGGVVAHALFVGKAKQLDRERQPPALVVDRKSTRLNSSHSSISYAVFCLKKKINEGSVTLRTDPALYPASLSPMPRTVSERPSDLTDLLTDSHHRLLIGRAALSHAALDTC